MSEEASSDQKTEAPSERKIQEALDKGNVPFSKEVVTFTSLMAITGVTIFLMPSGAYRITQSLKRLIEDPGDWSLTVSTDAAAVISVFATDVAWILAPLISWLFITGIAGALVQNQPRMVLHRIKPQMSRVSLKSGWRRLFGAQGLVEFLKAVFKFSAVSLVAIIVVRYLQTDITNAVLLSGMGQLSLIQSSLALSVAAVTVAAALLAIADFAWSRFHWHRELRMTKEELKNEHKQLEGDPMRKARMRSIARERSRNRMIINVADATVVIANPTHFSVALRYRPDLDPAPLVLAKGQDYVALKIREVAEANDIPIIEDKLLARSLHEAVEVDALIPPEFYRAVAEIVLFLNTREKTNR